MSYTPPTYVDTKAQAILALASVVADEDKTALGDGSVNKALDVLADAMAAQDVSVPQTNAGAILALAQYAGGMVKPEGTITITENGEGIDVAQYATADVSVSGGGGDNEFIAALMDSDGFQPFVGTLSVGGNAISYTIETFFAGTENEFEAAVASVPVGSVVTYGPAASENGMMSVFESEEAFLSGTADPILSATISNSVIVPAGSFLAAMFDVTR